MPIMKIKVQSSSNKAGGSRGVGQGGAGHGLGGCAEGGQRGAACCVCSGGLWIRGWEELLRLWGQWWERLPGPAPGPAPSNGRILVAESQTLCLPNGLKNCYLKMT